MHILEAQEDALVESLLAQNVTKLTQTLDGREVVVQRISAAAVDPGKATTVHIATTTGATMEIAIPASVLDKMGGDAMLVASVFNVSETSFLFAENGEANVEELKAVMDINLRGLSGQKTHINNLAEPILLSLPTNYTPGMECAYWDESKAQWSSAGVTVVPRSGQLVCATTHLSFFGAVIRGIMKSLTCSQAVMFSEQSFSALKEGVWFYDAGAILLWLLLIFLLGTIAAALYVDFLRTKRGTWSDECFLIAMNHGYRSTSLMDIKEEIIVDMADKGRLLICWASLTGAIVVTAEVVYSALRDVIDEIGSQFCGLFGELRTFFDGLQENLRDLFSAETIQGGGESRRVAALAGMAVGMTGSTSTRAMATSMWCSLDDQDLIKEGLAMQTLEEEKAQLPAQTERQRKRMEFLTKMLDGMQAKQEHHHDTLTAWSSLPLMVGKIFLSHTPSGGVFLFSISISSGMRALFLTCELIGALAVVTFFTATESYRSRTSPAADAATCAMSGIEEVLGRLILIGVISAIVAALPVGLLSRIHHRSFIKMEYEGCVEWKRQLWKWRVQDGFVWLCGILYVVFCTLFIMLFFASVVPDDQIGWIVSGVVSLSEDLILVPLAVSFAFPFISMVILSIAAMFLKVERKVVLARRKSTEGIAMKLEGEGKPALPRPVLLDSHFSKSSCTDLPMDGILPTKVKYVW